MEDHQLLRYSRHILLDEIGIEGQQKILDAHALVIGAGGLGCPAAMYLAASGIGHITLVDDDTVDLTNLQRQIGHTTTSVGMTKVDSLAQTLRNINPTISIHPLKQRADEEMLNEWVAKSTVVLDCTDNYRTRHLVNKACVQHRKPLVSAAALRFDGQISVFPNSQNDAPCYACIFPPDAEFLEEQCSTMGVFAPLVGVLGAIQATEALKLIVGIGTTVAGQLLMLEGKSMQWSTMRVKRSLECAICTSHQ